jgi:hypothetical protein
MNQLYFPRTVRRRSHERGSALLIVFVFAAIIAIALYKEMPIAAFEARRQKEQTLIDRGHEYQRAVQLYYRKFQGRYPANIDMLENTNSMRFLRRRYTDPFTGKDDWRLLHAGPGGQLIDSKVQNANLIGLPGQNGTNLSGNSNSTPLGTGLSGGARNGFATDTGSSTGNAPNSGSATSSSVFGATASDSSSDSDVVVQPVAKRAPIIAATSQGSGTPSTSELDQDPSTPLLPSQDPGSPAGTAPAPGTAVAASGPTANGQSAPPNSMQMVQNLFGSGANQPQAQTNAAAAFNGGAGIGSTPTSTIGSTGNMSGGSFAGVASKAKGHTVKKVNDQTDYSLWEFWYDPTKDTSMGTTGAQQNGAGGQNVQNGTQLGQPANSAFGSTGSNQSNTQTSPVAAPTDNGTGTANTPAQPQ